MQQRRFDMIQAVIAFCTANPDSVNRNLAFKRALLKLQGYRASIAAAADGQRVSPGGAQAEKKLARASLCDAGAAVSGQLLAWATEREDAALSLRNKWNVSALEKLSDLNLEGACRDIVADAKAARGTDPEMGITEEEVLQLESLLGTFVEKKPLPRNKTASRSSNTATLAQLMAAAGKVLRLQMDKAAIKYKASEPKFYKEYKENRKVMDVGVRTEKKS